jgi:hypothetical protein
MQRDTSRRAETSFYLFMRVKQFFWGTSLIDLNHDYDGTVDFAFIDS